jgi:ribokinase
MRVAVIGHVEWTTIARIDRLPSCGEVLHAAIAWEGPAGGGAVAAVQLAGLAGRCVFFTALGDDGPAARTRAVLGSHGVDVVAVTRPAPTRTAVSLVDATRERTTITLGPRLHPEAHDALPWGDLGGFDAVFFAAGAAEVLRRARAAGTLVVTARELATASAAGVPLDAVVGSGRDDAERYQPEMLSEPPGLQVTTDGANGGTFSVSGGQERAYPSMEPPGAVVDTYGVGDNFAAALTYGLGAGWDASAALQLAAQRGAACLTVNGPFTVGAPSAGNGAGLEPTASRQHA